MLLIVWSCSSLGSEKVQLMIMDLQRLFMLCCVKVVNTVDMFVGYIRQLMCFMQGFVDLAASHV